MSKQVLRENTVVLVDLNGIQCKLIISTSEVDLPDPETLESTIHYTSTNGTKFTDDQIVEVVSFDE